MGCVRRHPPVRYNGAMPGFLNVQVIIGLLLILVLVAALALVVYDGLWLQE